MLRSIKRRVKSLGSDSRHSKTKEPSDSTATTTTLEQGDGGSTTTTSTTTNNSEENQKSPSGGKMRQVDRTRSEKSEASNKKVTSSSLSSFDKCIETSDAMIASSFSDQQTESILTDRKDTTTGLPDCSLLVSPDGELLLVPTGESKHLFRREDTQQQQPPSSSSFSELMVHGKEDYQSSVFIGDDLHGDKRLNRFSAKGWSIPATSLALEQAQDSLHHTALFCEQLVESKQKRAASTTVACETYQLNYKNGSAAVASASLPAVSKSKRNKNSRASSSSSWEIVDPRATDFEMTPERMQGPFGLHNTSTLARATETVRNYYEEVAEMESMRWNPTSVVLPTSEAWENVRRRCQNRQEALLEASRKAQTLEEKLRQLQKVAERKWQAVYKMEERVTKKMEDLMTERSKEKQKARLKQLQGEGGKHTAANANNNNNSSMSEEVWNMVSSVAETIDNGSYEPMCHSLALPAASDTASVASDDGNTTVASLPVDREDMERELGLPALRAAALQSEDQVVEAGDTLLNVLSGLDTLRRSAKVAAETCLVSAGNAQATCLRTLVHLEKQSLRERLRALDGIDTVLEAVDVRSDLDLYIDSDKRARGGSSHLAEDDDGGIASALATLSSHVEGTYSSSFDPSLQSLQQAHFDEDSSEQGEKIISTSKINMAVDKFFQSNAHLRADADETDPAVTKARTEYQEETVDFLCQAATGTNNNTACSKSTRSALCYALNAKRGTCAKLETRIQFDALCRLFADILTGCRGDDGVANAKMCMMLAQTFYKEGEDESATTATAESLSPRTRRIYIKSRLTEHPIWSSDEFWDTALSEQISESLAHSGVMSNFSRHHVSRAQKTEYTQTRKTKWHDLSYTERIEAAAQVHAVVFAQLGALAHSMIELGCGLDRSCAFVRRMSIRNQLPSSQRTILLSHLMQRDTMGRKEESENKDRGDEEKEEPPMPSPDSGRISPSAHALDAPPPETCNSDDEIEESGDGSAK